MMHVCSIVFSRLTADNIGRFLAFVIDGKVLMCPMVNAEITGGQCSIMGQLTKEETEDLAILLNSGKLHLHV